MRGNYSYKGKMHSTGTRENSMRFCVSICSRITFHGGIIQTPGTGMSGTEQLMATGKSTCHSADADIDMSLSIIYVLCCMLVCLHNLAPCSTCLLMLLAILYATSIIMVFSTMIG